ncbi:MAG: T9SS type A sorting domain-containing protein [Candidatus Eisenbacteria bacterium]|nr:T9SS type A sorting domain-containing protein [Candidatus Eisenbacteria bacterium]
MRNPGGLPALALVAAGLFAWAPEASANRPPHIRCATAFFQEEKEAAARTVVRPSRGGPSRAVPRKAMTPPPDPSVGDSWNWYIWKLNGPPQAVIRSCTVRGEGVNCYVVVEDSQWNVNVHQEQVDTILARFDSHSPGPYPDKGIYDLDTLAFGPPPDELDNDPKIYILYYDFDVNADGFFWYFDQYPDGTFPYASNECEVVYINCSDHDVAGDYLLAVVAHEFEHMIHWNMDEDEVAWVDEGCAELAMWLYGNPDVISGFNTNPHDPLVTWGGAWTDYIQTYLWTLYFHERYGGLSSIRRVVAEWQNSTAGYDAVLSSLGYGVSFTDVFGDWVVANFLDDTTLADGRYGYVGEDLPSFVAVEHSSYPVGPVNMNVPITACRYRRLLNGSPMELLFDGSDDAIWKPRVIEFAGGVPVGVGEIPLDGANAGSVLLPEFGIEHDAIVAAFAHASPYGSNAMTFSTAWSTGTVPGTGLVVRLDPNAPNPFNPTTEIAFSIERNGEAALRIYDASGRLVRTLLDGPVSAGENRAVWDGTGEDGRVLPSGVYMYRLDADGTSRSRKMTLMR